ncbi:MAG: membrane protein insertase YidC [Nitratireductor sp.]|nr:membrane protein insertase YidC [Nitratireductor sp.]
MDNNRNTFLAIALSLVVIVGWQFLYVTPKLEAEKRAAEAQRRIAEQSQQQSGTAAPGTAATQSGDSAPSAPSTAPSTAPGGNNATLPQSEALSRDAALAQTQRVRFENSHVSGSINLKGARFDDLQLKKYRETIKKDSPLITLLSPAQLANGYFAEYGFAKSGSSGDVPGPDTVWSLAKGSDLTPSSPVTLSYTNDRGVTFNREISIDDNYMLKVADTIANNSGAEITLSAYGRVTRFEKPKVQSTYILHEGLIGVFGEAGLEQATYKALEEDRELPGTESMGGWLGITDKYWATTLIPSGAYTPGFKYFGEGRPSWQAEFLAKPMTIAAGANATIEQSVFAGAKEVNQINRYESDLGIRNFDLLIDWGWFYFITKPMFWLLDNLFKLVGNFGVAILLGTVIIKAAVFPLANMSYKSMAQMKKLQPEMMALRERHADDKVAQQQEMMALYKREKINPAAGCWPMLIQIPIFFALYKVLYITIEMRHSPFFGWIQDLAAPDPTSVFNLFGLLPYAAPDFLPHLGVWPLIMGVTMFMQMQMNPAPPDPTQAMIFKWMPIVFTFMLAAFPAGLVIYWAWNNTLSIIQQSIIMKRHGTKIELFDNLRGLFARKPKPGE